jgi:sporulation protein YqfC
VLGLVKKNERLRQKVAESLELPKEVIMDAPKVTIIGNVQVNIENHRGIVEYNRSSIRINTSKGIFKITGADLMIRSIASEEVIIDGNIEGIDISV